MVYPREARIVAQVLATLSAICAVPAGVAQPGYPDFSTDKATRNALARCDHGSDNLVSWNQGKLWLGKVSVADVKVRPADAAGLHLDDDLAVQRWLVRLLHEAERPSHLFEHHRPHVSLHRHVPPR
ncbi:hypothetical protein FHS25_006633 [Rhizobium laguerreae]|uniref:Uncharacterized protein n=1 Tax=Rhizobium laguerreae TaxID=1076926 RepID=A0ABR6GIJ0_9HYPH|nr:hypothetical protein [Rhizobium laguerreae]